MRKTLRTGYIQTRMEDIVARSCSECKADKSLKNENQGGDVSLPALFWRVAI